MEVSQKRTRIILSPQFFRAWARCDGMARSWETLQLGRYPWEGADKKLTGGEGSSRQVSKDCDVYPDWAICRVTWESLMDGILRTMREEEDEREWDGAI